MQQRRCLPCASDISGRVDKRSASTNGGGHPWMRYAYPPLRLLPNPLSAGIPAVVQASEFPKGD